MVPPKKRAPHSPSNEPWPVTRTSAMAGSRSTFQMSREDEHGVSPEMGSKGDLRVPTCFPFFVKREKNVFLLKF